MTTELLSILLPGVAALFWGLGQLAKGLAEWNRSRRQDEKAKGGKKPRKRTSGARA